MGLLKQDYLSGLPGSSPGDLIHSGREPVSPALAGRFYTTESPGKPYFLVTVCLCLVAQSCLTL